MPSYRLTLTIVIDWPNSGGRFSSHLLVDETLDTEHEARFAGAQLLGMTMRDQDGGDPPDYLALYHGKDAFLDRFNTHDFDNGPIFLTLRPTEAELTLARVEDDPPDDSDLHFYDDW